MIEEHAISRLINRDPEIMSGTPVFMDTRVPVQILFDWLEDGEYSLDDFLENFPSVSREQAVAVLEVYKELLLAEVQ
jgi:uncharacterized protein (DUF433 family)